MSASTSTLIPTHKATDFHKLLFPLFKYKVTTLHSSRSASASTTKYLHLPPALIKLILLFYGYKKRFKFGFCAANWLISVCHWHLATYLGTECHNSAVDLRTVTVLHCGPSNCYQPSPLRASGGDWTLAQPVAFHTHSTAPCRDSG